MARIDLTAELQAFVTYLVDNGVDAALDVKDLQADPGCVWVTASGIDLDRLNGYTINGSAVCIVGDLTPVEALDALSDLVDKVVTLVDPTDTIEGRTVTVPAWGGSTLPAMVVPIQLVCDFTPEP